MTECERILSKGIFREDFLKEETMCDFFVDTDRKKLWMILLDLLMEFDRVCKKHNLKYFLVAGSLLGAIRHKGFIPWDDDLDVGMLREDYEKLLQIGPEEFSAPYFFQTPYTDPGYAFSFTKIRNSNTAGISNAFRFEKFNQGLFLDVFPFDSFLPETSAEVFAQINALNLDNSTYMRLSNPKPTEKDKARIDAYSGRDPLAAYDEIQRIARQYENQNTEYVTSYVSTIFRYERCMYPRSFFDQIIHWEFEGLMVPIPADYHKMLETQYGDYMQFPPPEKRGIWHDGIFDPDVSYTEYRERFWAEATQDCNSDRQEHHNGN